MHNKIKTIKNILNLLNNKKLKTMYTKYEMKFIKKKATIKTSDLTESR